jgi:RHS repeat-associated protein
MVKDSVTTTYTYNNNNQLTTEQAGGPAINYSYDDNGNLESKSGGGNNTSYTWDWRDRLVSVSQPGDNTSYEYDGDGTRVSKIQGGVKTKYINDAALPLVQVLCETDNSGTIQATYNYGNDLISMNRSGVNYYYNYDGLGSARQLTNSTGNVTHFYTYDGFGNFIVQMSSSNNPYCFTGEQQFGEADELVFLRARYYKPSIGRFLQADPFGMSPMFGISPDGKKIIFFNPLSRYKDGPNLYIYVKNNPLNFTDPSGMFCCDKAALLDCILRPLLNGNNRDLLSYCTLMCSGCADAPVIVNPFCGACAACGALGIGHVAWCFYKNCDF